MATGTEATEVPVPTNRRNALRVLLAAAVAAAPPPLRAEERRKLGRLITLATEESWPATNALVLAHERIL